MNWNAFKRLFHYLGRYKLRLILVMIAAVLSTLFTVLTPAVTGGITSELYDGVASGSFDWETIVWLLVTLIALYLVAQLFAILQSFSMTKLCVFFLAKTVICKLFMNPIDKVGKQEYSFSSRTDRVLKQVKPVRQEVLETVKQLKNSRCFPFGSISAPGF